MQLARGLDFLWPMGPMLALGISLGSMVWDKQITVIDPNKGFQAAWPTFPMVVYT